MIPASGNVLLAGGDDGYLMDKSLRFRASASAYLNRTPASAGNRKTWTWSGWVKRGLINHSAALNLFSASGTTFDNAIQFTGGGTNDILRLQLDGNNAGVVPSAAFYRDPSAWYHIVFAVDTTQATAANRVKIYVNGAEIVYGSTTYPTLNYDTMFNSTNAHNIGRSAQGSNLYFDGYLAEVNFIDGQALTPASFGETNALTGVWKPKAYTGTYGTNGFYLDFEDTSSVAALGTDSSGNSNTWTVNNISLTAGVTYDSMTDVPTLTSASAANYCVLNPLTAGTIAPTNGNLFGPGAQTYYGTIRPTSGKWYFEYQIGITADAFMGMGLNLYRQDGTRYNGSSYVSYGASYAINDIIGGAFDLTNSTVEFFKNNVSQGLITGVTYTADGPMVYAGPSNTAYANFGQRPFAFSPPTGYVALNTFNLPTATILKGNTVMDVNLWTGDGTSKTIVNAASFRPDLVWIKQRSGTASHVLTDSVRGAGYTLQSNGTDAEIYLSTVLTSFNSNGFSVEASGNTGANGATYVAWQWQAGQGTTSSNTNGSITSTVSVNATAGFSVVTYTGNGVSGATIGHGLGVAPKFIIVKNRTTAQSWLVYHSSIGNTNYFILNQTAASAASAGAWNNTSPTSSVFTVGNSTACNENGSAFVAYCFSEIDGFSKFGSYTGNGDGTNAPFVYTGFRPKLVIVKASSGVASWIMWDSVRGAYNVIGPELYADLSNAETTGTDVDLLSNGFKFRNSTNTFNAVGTYAYIAFAENPFRNSLAR